MSDLQNKVGIVTGGSSGIGFQIANVLAGDGATVYSISRTGAPKEGMGESVTGVIHLKGDISDMAAMKALVDEIERSEERRVGKECSEPCRSRWSPYH